LVGKALDIGGEQTVVESVTCQRYNLERKQLSVTQGHLIDYIEIYETETIQSASLYNST